MKSKINLLLVAAIALLASGCSKERDFKNVFKEHEDNVNAVDQESIYAYIPSSTDSPRSISANRPHWQGDIKLVKFRFTSASLDVVEVEPDGRFRDNSTNDKPVLSIPVTYLEYRCKENSAKECSNEEEENKDIAWYQKSRFKPDFSGMKIKEVNLLPIDLENLFANCNTEIDSRFVNYSFEENAVNIELEKTYRSNPLCGGAIESLSDITFDTRYHYSFVKLDELASKDYVPVEYPKADENKFGFFTTVSRLLSIDNRDEVQGEKTFLNRWNPKRGEIIYQLSEAFKKPEYARVKKATQESVAAVNRGLQEAGVDLKIRLEDPKGAQPGDLRNNMIILVEDPQATGVIGYGPTAANPLTGEILNGRVVMYLGTMKKYIRDTWDEVIEQKRIEKESISASKNILALEENLKDAGKAAHAALVHAKNTAGARAIRPGVIPGDVSQAKLSQIKREMKNYRLNAKGAEDASDVKSRLNIMSKYNIYMAEHVNFDEAIESATLNELKDLDAKPWADLSDSEKERIINAVLPYVWIPTLVHELGHNMGLRHNFAGSEDKANFYTAEELHLGHDHFQKLPQYSSIMDYGYHNLNELRLMGKYDVAALRFGYARKVEAADGSTVNVPATLKALGNVELKDYQYCTDENTGINAGCKRFDEGTNYTEIASHLVEAYKKNYFKRNYRNGRRNFSLLEEGAYAEAVDNTMREMRTFFEVYERLQNRFNLTPEQWESIAFLKDLKDATQIALDFLVSTIETPDLMCGIVAKANPSQIAQVVPMSQLGNHTSCFDPSILEGLSENFRDNFMIVAETGKAFNSIKDDKNENAYADQIDLRGIWVDKALATKYLFQRRLGVSLFDENAGNFLDTFPGAAEKVVGLVDSVYSDSFTRPTEFRIVNGQKVDLELSYGLFDSHIIKKPMDKSLGIEKETPFASLLTNAIYSQMRPTLSNEISTQVLQRYKVWTDTDGNGREASDFKKLTIDGRNYFALIENTFTLNIFRNVEVSRILSKIPQERLEAIHAVATALKNGSFDPKMHEGMSDLEKQATQLDPETIVSFIQGAIKSEKYYGDLLSILVSQQ